MKYNYFLTIDWWKFLIIVSFAYFVEEDKIDDGIEAVPSIRNLKSRFESKDAAPPLLPADHSTRNR